TRSVGVVARVETVRAVNCLKRQPVRGTVTTLHRADDTLAAQVVVLIPELIERVHAVALVELRIRPVVRDIRVVRIRSLEVGVRRSLQKLEPSSGRTRREVVLVQAIGNAHGEVEVVREALVNVEAQVAANLAVLERQDASVAINSERG